MKKKIIIPLFSLLILLILGLGVSLFIKKDSHHYTLVVIPHFMIYPQRVSDFYDFIKNKYFYEKDPDIIVLLSPNHFFPQQKKVEGLNKEDNVKYKEYSILGEPIFLENIDYSGNVFYNLGEQRYVKDHGLGEHFRWISQYFPDVKVVPLALPTHDMLVSKDLAEYIRNLKGNVLVIASVDFSHYKSEDIALENDKISYETLSNSGNFLSLKKLDVDCPSCLGTLYLLAEGKKLHQWMRDSSSSLVGYDLKEENTSRQFLYRE